jgi:ABC-type enterobactin transport system permease subunit
MTSGGAEPGPVRLLISGLGRHGIVAATSQFVFEKGDVERAELARAMRWHLQDRIIVYENRAVVL